MKTYRQYERNLPDEWWTIKHPISGVLSYVYCNPVRGKSQVHFMQQNGFQRWIDAYRAGYRCVKIKVEEVK